MTMPKQDTEELKFFPRNIGKNYLAWQQFIKASRAGEDAAYRMPEGDICSPARVKKLIDKSVNEARKEMWIDGFLAGRNHNTTEVENIDIEEAELAHKIYSPLPAFKHRDHLNKKGEE